jgi:hypothetical protein
MTEKIDKKTLNTKYVRPEPAKNVSTGNIHPPYEYTKKAKKVPPEVKGIKDAVKPSVETPTTTISKPQH